MIIIYFKKLINIVLLPLTASIKWFFVQSLGKQVLIGVFLGFVVGIALKMFPQITQVTGIEAENFKILGHIFLDLVKMVVVPLVFASISSAIISIDSIQKLGKTAGYGLSVFFCTTVIAIFVGLFCANILQPGKNIDTSIASKENVKIINTIAKSSETSKVGVSAIILDIIPDNVFKAAYNGNLLQVIFFTVLFSVAISMLKNNLSENVIKFINSLANVMYAMIRIVMKFSPFGLFGLVVWIIGSQDVSVVKSFLLLILTMAIGILILILLVYPTLLMLIKVNPIQFMRKMIPVQLFALTTGSSAATLPMNMKNAQEKLGISDDSSQLLMPIGATVNMNGSGCSLMIYVLFVTQMYHIDLSFFDYTQIILLCFLGAVGNPPVPGGGVIMLYGILNTLGYPIEIIALILAVDKIIGPIRTLGNVTGDAFAPLFIDCITKGINKKKYLSSKTIAVN